MSITLNGATYHLDLDMTGAVLVTRRVTPTLSRVASARDTARVLAGLSVTIIQEQSARTNRPR